MLADFILPLLLAAPIGWLFMYVYLEPHRTGREAGQRALVKTLL
jgi:hypothetical protein